MSANLDQFQKLERKLLLHFDARNTIFVADIGSRIPVEHAFNTYIAGVIWGEYTKDGKWVCISTEPSLCAPKKGAISVYKKGEREIVKVPEDRPILRTKMGNFTLTDEGAPYYDLVVRHLNMFRWHHGPGHPLFTVIGLDKQLYHYLLPSFFNMIYQLSRSDRQFCILLRTFGRDAMHVLSAVEAFLAGLHPDFPDIIPSVPLNKSVEYILHDEKGKLRYTYTDSETNQKISLTSERDIYDHWNRCSGVIAVVDDYQYWHDNDFNYTASKPLWFENLTESQLNRPGCVQHIIFDDNIRIDDDDNIINLRRLDQGKCTGVNVDPTEASQYENVYFVQADLLESTEDPNYFIKKVTQCENRLNDLCKECEENER